MTRYGMLIDVDRCTGCFSCFLACRDEHAGNDHRPVAAAQPPAGQSWIRVQEKERGSFPKVKVSYVAVPCLHCAEAKCMEGATGGAITRRSDGIVLIDPDKAEGQRGIVSACPYGVIFWNEEKNLPQKCTFCAHLLDAGWKEPRCVEACPTRALVFGDLNDPASGISQLRAARPAEELRPELGSRPLVGFFGLPKRFIAGEIALGDRMEDCAVGVKVSLAGGTSSLSTATDNYGDFEFEDLPPDAEYVLRIAHAGYKPRELRVRTASDLNVGSIVLEPAR